MANFDPELFNSCSRCGGSGRYSFNLMTGDTCFKCGGRGWTSCKSPTEVTADISDAKIGDVVLDGAKYMIVAIRWINNPDALNRGNQVLTGRRLVDRKYFKLYRTVINDSYNGVESYSVPDGQLGKYIAIEPEYLASFKDPERAEQIKREVNND